MTRFSGVVDLRVSIFIAARTSDTAYAKVSFFSNQSMGGRTPVGNPQFGERTSEAKMNGTTLSLWRPIILYISSYLVVYGSLSVRVAVRWGEAG